MGAGSRLTCADKVLRLILVRRAKSSMVKHATINASMASLAMRANATRTVRMMNKRRVRSAPSRRMRVGTALLIPFLTVP